MIERVARCGCGAVEVTCRGEPVRVSVCHCLDCQRRSGSAFSAQARWADGDVTVRGTVREWRKAGAEGRLAAFRFCASCGSTVSYVIEALPGLIAVPLGAFADPDFPPPHYSVFETRKHAWLRVEAEGMEHYD